MHHKLGYALTGPHLHWNVSWWCKITTRRMDCKYHPREMITPIFELLHVVV